MGKCREAGKQGYRDRGMKASVGGDLYVARRMSLLLQNPSEDVARKRKEDGGMEKDKR